MSKAEKFIQLENELSIYRKMMTQAAQMIVNEEISNYPIMVAHQQELEIGIPISEKENQIGNWSIHASTLEEFVSKNIIFSEKLDEFKTNFKDAEAYICVFVISELGAQFIYLPSKL